MGPIFSFIEFCVDSCRNQVKPVAGSIVYCDLHFGWMEHSGVYIGKGKIVHLNGKGVVEAVTAKQFLAGKTGYNIYVSCKGEKPVGSDKVAERARERIGMEKGYNFILDNCHEFTAGCLTGEIPNPNNFVWMLKHEVEKAYGSDNWRFWNNYFFDKPFD
ncbi:lecithin retinol acyltransferase family protein [Salinicola sp. MIT1003]|uniref:lecithin retinol acyltransferase family protein n=1 Tax=Salinicola sp. MIT1003 TaxID=1882734 RepID=UPI001B355054|nr:lecithin retinol acyltransferase family protein [Salinicola sp. MIT1003]